MWHGGCSIISMNATNKKQNEAYIKQLMAWKREALINIEAVLDAVKNRKAYGLTDTQYKKSLEELNHHKYWLIEYSKEIFRYQTPPWNGTTERNIRWET